MRKHCAELYPAVRCGFTVVADRSYFLKIGVEGIDKSMIICYKIIRVSIPHVCNYNLVADVRVVYFYEG